MKAGGEGDDKGGDGWMASLTLCTWVWASSRDGEGQGSLAFCSLWSHKGLDTTEWLNNNKGKHIVKLGNYPHTNLIEKLKEISGKIIYIQNKQLKDTQKILI